MWDFETNQCVMILSEINSEIVRSVFITNDNKYIISGNGKTIKIWDLQKKFSNANIFALGFENFNNNKNYLKNLNGHTEDINSICMSNDNKYIISGGNDCLIKICNFNTLKCYTLFGHTFSIYSICITNDDKHIISDGADLNIKIWDFNTKKCISSLYGHKSFLSCICIDSDLEFIVSGCGDGNIKIWDFFYETCVCNLNGHIGGVKSLCISHDNKFIVSAGSDGIMKIWR